MERDQLEKMTREYQALHEQLEGLTMQKDQFSAQKDELKEAHEEVGKATGKVYLAIGGAIVSVEKETALKRIKEQIDSAEMRLTIVNKQHADLSKKEQTMRSDINAALKDLKQ